jgi:PleD family two-component response regulator
MRLAERLRLAVAGLQVRPDGALGPVAVAASFGVAQAESSLDAGKDLFAAADRALYAAKAAGKNRCVLAGPGRA